MFGYECMVINKICNDVEYNELVAKITSFITENGG